MVEKVHIEMKGTIYQGFTLAGEKWSKEGGGSVSTGTLKDSGEEEEGGTIKWEKKVP